MASLTLDWLHLASLLGAIQGGFLAGILATKRTNRTASRLLAALMLAFSVYLATAVYHAAGLVERFPHFFGVAYPLPLLFGPLIYLYAVCAADRSRRLTRRDALHLVPFVAAVLGGLPIYLMSGADKVDFFHALVRGERPLLLRIVDPLKLVSGIVYAALTIGFLGRHRERVKESYSSTEQVSLRWLVSLGLSAAFIWGLAIAFQLLESAKLLHIARADDIVSLAVAVLVYGIGYRGLRQPEIFRYETAEFPIPRPPSTPRLGPAVVVASSPTEPMPSLAPTEPVERMETATAPDRASEAAPRYERSGLSPREGERLRTTLVAVMDRDRPWRESNLTLADLAERLDTTPHKLSEVLNTQLGQTFYDFVNGYRVREVQRRIAAGDSDRVTMLTLALDAGFASKSTFNLVFKKLTNQTPSDFRQAAGGTG